MTKQKYKRLQYYTWVYYYFSGALPFILLDGIVWVNLNDISTSMIKLKISGANDWL